MHNIEGVMAINGLKHTFINFYLTRSSFVCKLRPKLISLNRHLVGGAAGEQGKAAAVLPDLVDHGLETIQ
jgi:hypothetical protein